MIPICLSPGDPSASLDQNGICLQAVPLSKGWVFPTVPLQSLPVSQEAPRQRPDSFCWLTQPQKEKCNTYLRDYLESRVSLWKGELCGDETCDTRKWFDAAPLAWGRGEFSTLQICEDAGWKLLRRFEWCSTALKTSSVTFCWTSTKTKYGSECWLQLLCSHL